MMLSMLESVPTVVINSAVDWPAVVAGISAGVAALAGIGATLWQASRTWGREDKRAHDAEKRRIYARLIAASTDLWITRITWQSRVAIDPALIPEYTIRVGALVTAAAEVRLIAPQEVWQIADQVTNLLPGYPTETTPNSFNDLHKRLIEAMRADLGERSPMPKAADRAPDTPRPPESGPVDPEGAAASGTIEG